MTQKPPSNKGRRIAKINAFTQARLIRLMLDGMMTCDELAAATGLHPVTVQHYTRELHREGACYIDHWEKDTLGRDAIKVYKIGQGKDAKRARLTAVQRSERYRSKMRALKLIQRMAA